MQSSNDNPITETAHLATAPSRSERSFIGQRQPLAAAKPVAGGAAQTEHSSLAQLPWFDFSFD